jgi:hypothetical protein
MIKLIGDRTDEELNWFIADCKKCIEACDKYPDATLAKQYNEMRLKEAEAEKTRRMNKNANV